jgi:NADPH:quinone reductase-like Zn-dependent oxidoreductase
MPHAIQIRQTGGPEVLNWTPIEVGELGSGQVRLHQAAAALNYVDVSNMSDYVAMNGIYAKYFSQPFPARTAIGVAALPLGARVEIDLVVKA